MRILTALGIALATVTIPAAPLLAQASADFALPAGRYTSDKDHTQLLWSVSHMGFSNYSGRFTGLDGILELDPAQPAKSKVTFTVDTGSVDAFNTVLTGELKGDKWFDAAKFPKATFQSTSVAVGANNSAKVTGI